MAFENLIVRKKRQIGGITIDGIISENTNRSMRLTNNPLEDGSNVADHIITDPLTYTLEGVITDTPLGLEGFTETVTGVVDTASGIFGASDASGQTRSQQIYAQLVALMEEKQLLTVQTSIRLYDDLVMESIIVTTDKDKRRAIFFTAGFKQAIVVKSSFTGVNPVNIDGEANKAGLGNTLKQGNTPINPLNESETRSMGSSLDNVVG